MYYPQKEEGVTVSIGGWKKPKTRNGGGANRAKALLRKMDKEQAKRKPKDRHSTVGLSKSGMAGRRNRQNFLWAMKTRQLLKRMGL